MSCRQVFREEKSDSVYIYNVRRAIQKVTTFSKSRIIMEQLPTAGVVMGE